MARIDWALACSLAFFDRYDRLCLVGVTRRLPVPRLPLALNELMLVARLVELSSAEEIDVAVAVVTPSGLRTRPTNEDGVVIEMAGDYVLVSLRGLPLVEEGVHRFQISLGGQTQTSFEIPVLMAGSPWHADVH